MSSYKNFWEEVASIKNSTASQKHLLPVLLEEFFDAEHRWRKYRLIHYDPRIYEVLDVLSLRPKDHWLAEAEILLSPRHYPWLKWVQNKQFKWVDTTKPLDLQLKKRRANAINEAQVRWGLWYRQDKPTLLAMLYWVKLNKPEAYQDILDIVTRKQIWKQ